MRVAENTKFHFGAYLSKDASSRTSWVYAVETSCGGAAAVDTGALCSEKNFSIKGSKAAGEATYDMRSIHGAVFGGGGGYLMDGTAVMDALERFLADEGVS